MTRSCRREHNGNIPDGAIFIVAGRKYAVTAWSDTEFLYWAVELEGGRQTKGFTEDQIKMALAGDSK